MKTLQCGCQVSSDGKQIIKMCYDHYNLMSSGTVQEPPKKLFGIFRTDIFKDPRQYKYFTKYKLFKGRII